MSVDCNIRMKRGNTNMAAVWNLYHAYQKRWYTKIILCGLCCSFNR